MLGDNYGEIKYCIMDRIKRVYWTGSRMSSLEGYAKLWTREGNAIKALNKLRAIMYKNGEDYSSLMIGRIFLEFHVME